jgi:hypothetical protein
MTNENFGNGIVIYNEGRNPRNTHISLYGNYSQDDFNMALFIIERDKNVNLIFSKYGLTSKQSKKVLDHVGIKSDLGTIKSIRGLVAFLKSEEN